MIRLLTLSAKDELILETFGDHKAPPPYAILSHTWEKEGEVAFKDLQSKSYKNKAGFQKIRFCGTQARKDEIYFFWVDTCCIDKDSHAELSEAITSMFRWYHEAVKCYVYLSDISTRKDGGNPNEQKRTSAVWTLFSRRQPPVSFANGNPTELKTDYRRSRWFTRGWTLQELIAPKSVEFFSREGDLLGTKVTLEQQLVEVTQIPLEALRGAPLSGFRVEERLRWADGRKTTRKEDKAYCLLGIFNVFMGPIYGEGDHAFTRLMDAIDKAKPPSVSFTVPFRRDPHFIDRPDLLARIHDNCSSPATRTALVGLGGVGKSQLAIEFCYRVRNDSPQTSVFWIHASNADRFRQGFSEIAQILQLPGWKDAQADVFGLVHDWLRNERNGKWLLVLDNVDDATFLVDGSSSTAELANSLGNTDRRRLIDYIPYSQEGSVLVSSRTRNAALRLVEADDIVEVSPMEEESAVALIAKKLQSKADGKEMLQLAKTLEYMPLAMVQATSYIAERWPRFSISQYIAEFEKNDNSQTNLLKYEAGQLRRDGEAKNSILTTWQISFDHIYKTRRSAADLLSLMSFFDRQGIPELALCNSIPESSSELPHDHVETVLTDEDVKGGSGEEDENERQVSSKTPGELPTMIQFEQDILILRQFSFVSLSTDNRNFEMHSLVQLATRIWLEAHGQNENWKQAYISRLYSVMPQAQYEAWEKCRILFPHAKTASAQQVKNPQSQKEWSTLLFRAGTYAFEMGNISDAEVMLRKSLETRQTLLGPEHPNTLNSRNNLAEILRVQGRYFEAEQMHREILNATERTLGPEHPDTLRSMNNLAEALSHQGKYIEAEQMHRQVMEVRVRTLGREHPATLNSMNNLAESLSDQGKYIEAEQMHRQVMEARVRTLGQEHPATLISMNNLAEALSAHGGYIEAEQMHRQALEVRERILGKEHPDTVDSMSNLAVALSNQGEYFAAKQMDLQVTEVRKRTLGKEHPDTLHSMTNLAVALSNDGEYFEAEQIHRQVVAVRERVLGKEHPDTLHSVYRLANTRQVQGDSVEAIQLLEQCLTLQSRVLGTEHPDTQSSSIRLAQWRREALNLDTPVAQTEETP